MKKSNYKTVVKLGGNEVNFNAPTGRGRMMLYINIISLGIDPLNISAFEKAILKVEYIKATDSEFADKYFSNALLRTKEILIGKYKNFQGHEDARKK